MTGRRDAIEHTLARYAWLFDAGDMDTLSDCFTEDAVLEVGERKRFVGRGAVIDELRRRRERYRRSDAHPWHLVSTVEVVSEDAHTASVRSRFALTLQEATGPPRLAGVGWYDDELSCVDGRWLIRSRRVRRPSDA
jgi:hypothetical protein